MFERRFFPEYATAAAVEFALNESIVLRDINFKTR